MRIKVIAALTLIGLLIGFLSHAQQNQGFTINGYFKGLPNGTKVIMNTQEKDTIAIATSKEDRFVLKGKLSLNGRFHFIHFDKSVSKVGTKSIFVVNDNMTVSGTVGLPNVVVMGSAPHQDNIELANKMDRFDKSKVETGNLLMSMAKKANEAYKKGDSISGRSFRNLQDEYFKKLDTLGREQILAIQKWISQHPASLYSPYVIIGFATEQKQKAYDLLTPEAKASYYGVKVKKELESARLANQVKPGKVLPDFKVSSIDQQSFSVLEYAKKGKITLLDFWASWCKPCRAETPNMKRVYDAFHDKGFNIIGVSTDAKEADWQKALTEENTHWFHGRDNLEKALKGIFSISAIPAFALVDSEGKLIAFSCAMSNIPSFGPPIQGEELYKTIENLLKDKTK